MKDTEIRNCSTIFSGGAIHTESAANIAPLLNVTIQVSLQHSRDAHWMLMHLLLPLALLVQSRVSFALRAVIDHVLDS